jgi:hypothetical protein
MFIISSNKANIIDSMDKREPGLLRAFNLFPREVALKAKNCIMLNYG